MSLYGYCPQCGTRGIRRERRLDGNDTCELGHTYPTAQSQSEPYRLIERLTRENAELRARLEAVTKDRDNELADNTGLALKIAAVSEELDNFKAIASRETSRRLAAEKARDAQAGGCFFCRDCDAVRCEQAVLAPLRHIAEQAGKRNWWNVMYTILELNKAAIQAMNRDINNPTAATAVKEAGNG